MVPPTPTILETTLKSLLQDRNYVFSSIAPVFREIFRFLEGELVKKRGRDRSCQDIFFHKNAHVLPGARHCLGQTWVESDAHGCGCDFGMRWDPFQPRVHRKKKGFVDKKGCGKFYFLLLKHKEIFHGKWLNPNFFNTHMLLHPVCMC